MEHFLFVIDSLQGGGAERVIVSLANKLSEIGYHVDILVCYSELMAYIPNSKVNVYNLSGKIIEKKIYTAVSQNSTVGNKTKKKKSVITLLHEGISERRDCYRRGKQLADFINANDIDTVVSFLTSSNILATIAKQYVGARIIISERCAPNESFLHERGSGWALRQYSRADAIVFQTIDAKMCYPKQIRNKGYVIPNPINPNLPLPYSGKRERTIVSFGRLASQKNLSMLIRAFAEVYKQHRDYQLKLYGNGPCRSELEELSRSLEIGDAVIIDDYKPNIHEIIKNSAMYVSSSNYEGISNSMLEAMAIGLPVICTDCPVGGAKLVIRDGVNGLLVAVGDEKALIEKMNCLIEDDEYAKSLGEHAVEIRNEYSIDAVVQMWLKVMER